MKSIRGLSSWIGNDPKKHQWIYSYLSSKQLLSTAYLLENDLKGFIGKELERLSLDQRGQIDIRDMRRAWSSKKYNEKNENQALNLTLHPQKIKQLDSLAKSKNQSRRTTLEEIITRNYDADKQAQKELKREVEIAKASLEKKWPKQSGTLSPMEQLTINTQLKTLQYRHDKQAKAFDSLLFRYSELRVLAGEAGLDKSLLEDTEKEKVARHYSMLKSYYDNDLDKREPL